MPKDLVYNVKVKYDSSKITRGQRSIENATERTEKSIQDVTNEIRNQIRFLDLQREKGNLTAQELTQEYGRLERQLEKLPQSFRGTVAAQEKLISSQRRVSNSIGATRNSVSGANQALFSFGDIVNDAQQFQFGFAQGSRAIGNNIAFMSEQFANVANRAGGFTAGLKALGSSMLGPGGIIIGINLAISALTIFGDKLFSSKEEVEDFGIEVKETTDFVNDFLSSDIGSFLDQFEEIEQRAQAVKGAIESILGVVEEGKITLDSIADAQQNINQRQTMSKATLAVINNLQGRQDTTLTDIEKRALNILENKQAEIEAQKLINQFAREHLEIVEETEEEQKAQIDAITGVDLALVSGEIITPEQREQLAQERKEQREEASRIQKIQDKIKDSYVETSRSINELAGISGDAIEDQALAVQDTIRRISTVAGIAGQAVQALFGQSKAAAIASAIINGAQAITKTFAEYGFTPFGIGAAAAQAAVTAAQIAKIKSTEPGSESSGDQGISAPSEGIQTREREAPNMRSTTQASTTRKREDTTLIVEAKNVLPDTEFSVRSDRGRRKREKRAKLVGD